MAIVRRLKAQVIGILSLLALSIGVLSVAISAFEPATESWDPRPLTVSALQAPSVSAIKTTREKIVTTNRHFIEALSAFMVVSLAVVTFAWIFVSKNTPQVRKKLPSVERRIERKRSSAA